MISDVSGIVTLSTRTDPDPPAEDRFLLVGRVVATSAVLGIEIEHAGAADVRPAADPADRTGDAQAYEFTAPAYQSLPGFPRLSLRITTAAGAITHEVRCPVPDPVPFKPVFESGLTLPRTVCIMGSGPGAAEAATRRPPGVFTIALNKAVLLPGLAADIWLMNQLTSDSLAYYHEAAAAHPRIPRLFRLGTALATAAAYAGRDDCSWFLARQAPGEELRADRDLPTGRLVRAGATVAGCALQIAFAVGAKEILLGGIDMRGDVYWDGTKNPRDPKQGDWKHVSILDRLITHLCTSHGGMVWTLGDTALKAPRRWLPA
jgi:hypothetical protein